MPSIRILYIDDEPREAQHIAELLDQPNSIEVTCALPKQNLVDNVDKANPPDLFLVDYILDMVPEGEPPASYKGTTLSAVIKGLAEDYPVVLLTRPSFAGSTNRWSILTQFGQLIDEMLYKDVLNNADGLSDVRKILRSLALGYQELGTIYFLVGKSNSPLGTVQKAYSDAVTNMRNNIDGAEIIEEDYADEFAIGLARKIAEHKEVS